MTYYILDAEHQAAKVDLHVWAHWFENDANRRVAYTEINSEVTVSTVFLGLDHNFGGGPPVLFETMIFGGPKDEEMWRYSTWDDAITNHEMIVKKMRSRYVKQGAKT